MNKGRITGIPFALPACLLGFSMLHSLAQAQTSSPPPGKSGGGTSYTSDKNANPSGKASEKRAKKKAVPPPEPKPYPIDFGRPAGVASSHGVQPTSIESFENHRKVALLVGVGPASAAPERNAFDERNALEMGAVLTRLGYQTTVFTQGQATADAIRSALTDAGLQGGTVLLYYSGHGVDIDGDQYLATYDSLLTQDAKRGLTVPQIEEIMRDTPAQQRVVWIDISESRSGPDMTFAAKGIVRETAAPVQILVGQSDGRGASDNPLGRDGGFTGSLRRGLSGAAADPSGAITENGLANFVTVDLKKEGLLSTHLLAVGSPSNDFVIGREPIGSVTARPAAEAWAAIRESKTPEDFDNFARAFPSSDLAAGARRRAAELRSPRQALVGGLGARSGMDRARPEKWVNPKDGLSYVWIEPGTFTMGCAPADNECYPDEMPARRVIIAKGFWIGQIDVTQLAYQAVTGKNPSHFKGAKLPVEDVNWGEARNYCQATGMRLPTEAEWEYAAKAGGDAIRYGLIDRISWYGSNSDERTHEVAEKEANAWGLYDMLGNVWQWMADKYGASDRSLRGGAFHSPSRLIRASDRYKYDPRGIGQQHDFGVRCAGGAVPSRSFLR